jgi:nitrous oxidase accessory protein
LRLRPFVATRIALALVSLPTASAAEVVHVKGGSDLQAAVDRASPGDVVDLADGVFAGPVRLDTPIVLRGRGAVIDGGGRGTTLVLAATGLRVEGITVRDSGEDIGAPDACIFVEPVATDSTIRDCELRRCAFGIWVHETRGVEIIDNVVESREEVRASDRGNGIHLFNASHLVVRGNRVTHARDGIYVSATEDSLIEHNVTSGVRFGIHYMYSYRNRLLGNEANDNTVGIALMESRDLVVDENRADRNTREGILFRDVIHSEIRNNSLRRNGTGMFFYSSTENVIEGNEILDNELGMKVWAGSRRNRIEGNVIRGNRNPVFYVGAEDQIWGESGRGNFWGDYLGWDQNGDGVGDRPHRVDSFTAGLLYRYPSAVLLLRSPALEMLAHLADQLVLLRAPTIIDLAPLLREDSR